MNGIGFTDFREADTVFEAFRSYPNASWERVDAENNDRKICRNGYFVYICSLNV